jgi:hypothetical protein
MKKSILSFVSLSFVNLFFASLFFCAQCFAQINQPREIQTSQKFGAYTVHYSVFNSQLIPPEVAGAYKIVRSKDLALINVSLTKTENGLTSLGLPAVVKVKAVNLMQQAKSIDMMEIKEPEATYYLGAIRHTNEEDLRFEISVLPLGEKLPFKLNANRRLYLGDQ